MALRFAGAAWAAVAATAATRATTASGAILRMSLPDFGMSFSLLFEVSPQPYDRPAPAWATRLLRRGYEVVKRAVNGLESACTLPQ